MEKIKVGIIGTGRSTSITKGHLMGIKLSPWAELGAVYDLSAEASCVWCENLGVDKSLSVDSLDELYEKCSCVTVATPNNTHADYIVDALEKGKHILVEKPVSNTVSDIPRIEEALSKTRAVGGVNLSYRRIPAIAMLHDFIQCGEAGEIYTIRHNMGGSRLADESIPFEWRFRRDISGAGALTDFGSHALDILHYILGEGVTLDKFYAFKDTFIKEREFHGEMRKVENDDVTALSARLSTGALYSLLLSRVGTTPSLLEIVASKAIISYRMDKSDRIFIKTRESGGAYDAGVEYVSTTCREEWHSARLSDVPYLAAAENVHEFLGAVKDGRKMDVSIEYGLKILREVDSIEKKAE